MGKSTKKPETPNFSGIAQQQAAEGKQNWSQALQANRPNQSGPTGSLTWQQDPSGNWSQTTTMNPQEQQIMEQRQQEQLGIGGKIGEQIGGFDTGQIDFGGAPAMPGQSDYSTLGQMPQPSDFSSLGAMPEVGGYDQRSIDTIRALQAPQLQRQRAAKEAQMAAMGLSTGSGTAWNTEQQNLSDAEGRADMNAIMQGIQQGNTMFGQGMQARGQGASELAQGFQQGMQGRQQGASELDRGFAQGMGLRQQGVGETLQGEQANLGKLSGLMGLARGPQMPTFAGVNQTGMAPTADLTGAASKQYGADVQRYNIDRAEDMVPWQLAAQLGGAALTGGMGGPAASGLMNYFNKPKATGYDSWVDNYSA